MKIKAIEVNNLFSYDEFKIEFNEGNIAVIVGPNNAGKSNLFRVLEFLKDVINNRIKAEDVPNYLHNDSNRFAKIVVDIEFDDLEKNLLKDYFEGFFKSTGSNSIETFLEICNKLNFNVFDELIDVFSKGQIIWEYHGNPTGIIHPYYKVSINKLIEISKELKNELSKWGLSLSDIEDDMKWYEFLVNKKTFNEILSKKPNPQKYKEFENNDGKYFKSLNKFLNVVMSYNLYYIVDKTNNILFISDFNNGQNKDILCDYLREFIDSDNGYRFLEEKYQTIKHFRLLYALLLALGLFYLGQNSYINYEKITNYVNENPLDSEIYEKIKRIFEYLNIEFKFPNSLLFHYFILKLFDKAIIKFEEVRGYPKDLSEDVKSLIKGLKLWIPPTSDIKVSVDKLSKVTEAIRKIPTYGYGFNAYYGNGKDLAKYLFYLKNSHELDIRNKYKDIRKYFQEIFATENIDFDVVNHNGYPEIFITYDIQSKDSKQLPIDRVGSGIFEVLNILAVVVGNKNKVILLDEPALHLHPIYQKRLLEDFKKLNLNENGGNQIIIITHSPYFVDSELLKHTFRFYKDKENGATKLVNIYRVFFEFIKEDIKQKLEKDLSNFESRLGRKININLDELDLNELEFLEKQFIKFNELNGKIGYLKKVSNKDGKYDDLIKKCQEYIDNFCNGIYKINLNEILEEIYSKIPKIKKNDDISYITTSTNINMMKKMFEENDRLIPSLFANGVILVEGISELITLPILIRKFKFEDEKYNNPLEKYNIEIINVGGKNGFKKYMKLMDSLNIPYCIVCDGDTAFNFYTNENSSKDKNKISMPIILKNLKELYSPDWLNDEYINKIKESLKLPNTIKNRDEIVEKCIKPVYDKIAEKLRDEYYIYACPDYDWTDFLNKEFSKEVDIPKNIDNKTEIAYIIAINASEDLVNEKLKDLKQFIQNFIKSNYYTDEGN
ncbi:AAA family ATPase [Methanocaldococcus sp. 16A]